MKDKIFSIVSNIRHALDLEDYLFLIGIMMLYRGLAVQFSHAMAQVVSGVVLLVISVLIAIKGSSS